MICRHAVAVAACLFVAPSFASVELISFTADGTGVPFGNGDLVVADAFAAIGVNVLVGDNFDVSGAPDVLRIFDTNSTGGSDPDLQGPPFSGGGNLTEAGGSLLPGVSIDNILILQENNTSEIPNDEGSRPAGTITFEFETPVVSFGFDLIDVEDAEQGDGFFATFFADGTELQTVEFTDFDDPSSPFFQPALVFADNSANRVDPLDVPGGTNIVEITLGGSSGIDNIVFATPEIDPDVDGVVPEAASLAVWSLLATLGVTFGRRREG